MVHKLRIALFIALIVMPLVALNALAAESDDKSGAKSHADKKEEPKPFATVDDTEISMLKYRLAYKQKARETFYHGKIPVGGVAKLQREVGEMLVEQVFLVREAKRRGLSADASYVNKQISLLEEKNKGNEKWAELRNEVIPLFIKSLEARQLSKILKEVVIEEMKPPGTAEVRKYYDNNKQKYFTEPEKVEASVIILMVDPSSGNAVWESTRQQAAKIISRIGKGEDFGSLAKEFSGHYSAENGGDLGFIHRGVMGDVSQQELDKLAPGEISREPLLLLEGFGIIKRGGTIIPQLHTFKDVEKRAQKLLVRDLEKSTWKEFKASLRKGVNIKVNDSFYQPLLSEEHESEHSEEKK